MRGAVVSSRPDAPPARSLPARWAVAFGRFWWDFLVGDTPELFVGALVALGAVALLVHAHAGRIAVVVALPLLVAALLAATLARAWRQGRH
jgi:hypothetical protein